MLGNEPGHDLLIVSPALYPDYPSVSRQLLAGRTAARSHICVSGHLSQTDQEHDYGHLQWPQCSLIEWWSIDTVEHRSSGLKID